MHSVFFNNIGKKIREQFETLPTYRIKNKDVTKLQKSAALSESNLYKLFMEMATKWCEIDITSNKTTKKSTQVLHTCIN